jgi:hypothetical protein
LKCHDACNLHGNKYTHIYVRTYTTYMRERERTNIKILPIVGSIQEFMCVIVLFF